MKILLVDDEIDFVSTLAERLSYRNIDVDWSTKGHEALKLAEKKDYDIAVLDVKMPQIDGFKLKRKLKKRIDKLKFIFLTGHGSENDYNTGKKEDDVEFYIAKPIGIEDLIEKIKTVFTKQGGDLSKTNGK